MNALIQIESGESVPGDLAIRQIARLMGIETILVPTIEAALQEVRRVDNSGNKFALAISGDSLLTLATRDDSAKKKLCELRSLCGWLIHGFPLAKESAKLFSEIFGWDDFLAASQFGESPKKWQFSSELSDSPLAGLSFEDTRPEIVTLFEGKFAREEILLSVNGRVALARRGRPPSTVYLLSQSPRVNLAEPLVPPSVSSDFHAEVLPAASALRGIFADACWHNPRPTGCVIVDDPWLRDRYGFFDYKDVLGELSENEYSTTVAFIPSNFRRSDPKVVQMVSQHRERISICVHGCDHTGGEFGETDAASIENKAATAMDNMRRHETITGLTFDRTMVFPQGVFSSCCLRALKKCGYLAAVNTVPYPTDHEAAPVSLSDTLQLAILSYDCFPIFTRRYPRNVFDFAADLFWGKPVFVVEHHGYFERGARRMSEFIRAIKQLKPRINWLTLENAVIRSCQFKKTALNAYDVRFLTARFLIKNPFAVGCVFNCRKPESDPRKIVRILVDGRPVEYSAREKEISVLLSLEPGEERLVELQYDREEIRKFKMSAMYRCKSLVRRRLSEIRDNHLSRNKALLNFLTRLLRTGGKGEYQESRK